MTETITTELPTVFVARSDQVEERQPKTVLVEGLELVLLKIDGKAYVYQGRCPHQGTSLGAGTIEGDTLICSSHGYRFDVRTGARRAGPGCLFPFPAQLEGGEIRIERSSLESFRRAERPRSPFAPSGKPARSLRDLPGPRRWPLVGNLFELRLPHLHAVLEGWVERYGVFHQFRLPQTDAVVVARPDTVRGILKDRPETFRRIHTFEPLLSEVGAHGVFSQEGESWRRHRRLVSPAFNSAQLKSFYPTLMRILGRLERRFADAALAGRALDTHDEMRRFTVDVTANLAFGHDLNTIEDSGGRLGKQLEPILPLIAARSVAPFAYWRYVRLPRDRALDRAVAELRSFVRDLVESARSRLAEVDPALAVPATFLESLVLARDEDGSKLDDEEIFGNVLTMLVAGEDTTANTLAWMVHFMTTHREVQSAMQAEVDALLGDEERMPTLAETDRLPYIDAVAKEAMRLKPVAPVMFLEPNIDVEIEGALIPKGTLIIVVTSWAPKQDEYFRAAARFEPERWLTNPAAGAPGHSPDVWLPFGFGPRHCPGRNLALLEIKVLMAMLCRRFQVEATPNHPPVEERFGFTMHATPISVRLIPRAPRSGAGSPPAGPASS